MKDVVKPSDSVGRYLTVIQGHVSRESYSVFHVTVSIYLLQPERTLLVLTLSELKMYSLYSVRLLTPSYALQYVYLSKEL